MSDTTESRVSVGAEFESVIRRFEQAWGIGRPDPADFLPPEGPPPIALLAELTLIDLEFRFRAGEQPRVEEYARRFPELNDPKVLEELVGGELAHRGRYGPPYDADEVRIRFPQLGGRLDALLVTRAPHDGTHPRAGTARWHLVGPPALPGYEVGEPLGRGGMGVVYRAEQTTPARTVALKTLLDVPGERTAARFRREAEAMARLDHPHIVPVYEVGEWAYGVVRLPYFTMKWYPGGSLDTAPSGPGTSVSWHARTVEIIARAVHHAHQRGVLHRDLKPSNILLDDAGKPAVADFGLAGWFGPDAPAPLSESVVGTPAFMAPEQVHDPSGVTTATDVYGLGAILYQRLTGLPPVPGSTPLVVISNVGSRPPDRPSAVNPAVPRDLETICLKCLEAEPRNRYPSAEAVADDLTRWRNGDSIAARRAGVWERTWRSVRRHPVVTALSLATTSAVLFSLIILAVSFRRVREKEAETDAAFQREKRALYLERVAAVGRLFQSNHIEQAWRTLDDCPPELREWEWAYLDRVRRASGGTVLRHADAVLSCVFLADGRVVTAERSQKMRVRVWTNGEPSDLAVSGSTLHAHPTRGLVAVRDTRLVTVVDVDANRPLFQTDGGTWVAFTPDGEHLLVAAGKVLKRYAVGSWAAAGEYTGHDEVVLCGVFTADGRTLFTGSTDRTVAVWDWEAKRVRERWKREIPVLSLSLSADEQTLFETQPARFSATNPATGSSRRLLDVSGGRPSFHPTTDPNVYAHTTTPGEVRLRTIDPVEPVRVYRGHTGVIYSAGVSRDRKRLVTGGEDGTARVWDLSTSAEYADLVTPPYTAGAPILSADGKSLAVVSRNVHTPVEPEVLVVSTETGREVRRVKGAGDAAFDPKGRWLAVGRRDGTITLYDAADGGVQRTLKAGTHATTVLAFRPDGAKMAAVEILGRVRVWDTRTWEATEYTPDQSVSDAVWSPDGRHLAVTDGAEVVIWEPTTGGVSARFKPANVPLVLAYSPDGRAVAAGGRGRSLELFDVTTGERRMEFVGNPSVVNGLAFHPSGTRLASVGVNGFARVWDTASGKEVLTLNGGGDLFGVAWSPDGKHLYAAGATARRWSADE